MKKQLLAALKHSVGDHNYVVKFWGGEVAEISLIDFPTHAQNTLIQVTRGYSGDYSNDPVTPEQTKKFLHDIKNTGLGTPIEMLNFVFLVRDVPRSFTHQIVRTRIGASYVQESTRFIGAKDAYDIFVPQTMHREYDIDPSYITGNVAAIQSYEEALTHKGAAAQDARNLLPHGIMTHLYWSINMKSLQVVYNQRFCCQAELGSWVPVVRGAKRLITEACGESIGGLLSAPVDRGEACGFNASFDRPCTWSNKAYDSPKL